MVHTGTFSPLPALTTPMSGLPSKNPGYADDLNGPTLIGGQTLTL